jgi:hypothetical protein
MNYEYKAIGAPEKPKRQRGARSGSDRAAAAFEEVLRAEAVDGWEYLRTDLVPLTERSGWFGHRREVTRAVMVFRRPLEAVWRRPAAKEAEEPAARREPAVGTAPAPAKGAEPPISAAPDRRLAEVVRGPGARPKEG